MDGFCGTVASTQPGGDRVGDLKAMGEMKNLKAGTNSAAPFKGHWCFDSFQMARPWHQKSRRGRVGALLLQY